MRTTWFHQGERLYAMPPIAADHPIAGSALHLAHSARAGSRALTVFIIDHDAAVRDALSISLRTSGFDVLSFSSAGHFLETRPRTRKGCLLVDFDLEDMRGTDLIARLAAERVMLPAIIMSASLRPRILKEPPPSGIVTILQKPFGRDALLTSLRRAFDHLK
ncbi:MAG: response regulator transcription factor [Geminicoccales bacterium]